MALHNPALEAAAVIRHALSARLVTLDFNRHWCAENKEQALQAIAAAAARIDDLRAWGLLAPADFRPAVTPELLDEIDASLRFLTGTAQELRACHMPHIAIDYDKAARLIERLSGITADEAHSRTA